MGLLVLTALIFLSIFFLWLYLLNVFMGFWKAFSQSCCVHLHVHSGITFSLASSSPFSSSSLKTTTRRLFCSVVVIMSFVLVVTSPKYDDAFLTVVSYIFDTSCLWGSVGCFCINNKCKHTNWWSDVFGLIYIFAVVALNGFLFYQIIACGLCHHTFTPF